MSDWEIEEVDDDIPKDTSGMTSMQSMFLLSEETTLDLSSFDTSKVVNMSLMFGYCSDLTTLDLSSFDTSKVTDMEAMFVGCDSLKTVILKTVQQRLSRKSSLYCRKEWKSFDNTFRRAVAFSLGD